MHVVAPSAALLAQVPVRLYVFDLLYLDGDLLLPDPYRERRARLEALGLDDASVTTPPVFDEGSSLAEVQAASASWAWRGLWPSGSTRRTRRVCAPRTGSRSRSTRGRGGHRWLDARRGPPGRHDRRPAARHVRRCRPAGLRWTGRHRVHPTHAGRPADDAANAGSTPAPFDDPVPRAHARDALWVRPDLVGEVVYRTLTADGRLRHPSWRGLRPDREPAEVRRTTVQPWGQTAEFASGGAMTSTLTRVITGRRLKYLIILFWLVVVAVAAPLAGQADRRAAERRAVVAAGQRRVDPGARRAGRVRLAGHHPGRRRLRTAVRAHPGRPGEGRRPTPRRSPGSPELDGEVIGPVPSADGQAAQIIVPLNLGADGWDKAGDERGSHDRDDRRPAGADGLQRARHRPGRASRPTRPRRSRASTARCCSPRSPSSW